MSNNKEVNEANAAFYFIDRHLNSKIENKNVFVEAIPEGRSITYKELSIETNKIIDLLTKYNIRREERVLMLVLDQIEFPIIFWGCLKAGVIPVPINTLLSKEVIQEIINESQIFYENSFNSISKIPIRSRFSVIVARRVYIKIGDYILKQKNIDNYNKAGKIYVPMFEKLIQTFLSIFDFIKLLFIKNLNYGNQKNHNILEQEINLNERI